MATKKTKDPDIVRTIKSLDKLQKELESLRMPKGDINYFAATAMLTQEIKHSAFLSWLLNPSKEHNLGSVMLERFVEKLFKYRNVKSKHANVKSNRDILGGKNIDKDSLLNTCKSGKVEILTEVTSSTGKRADICIKLQSNTDKREKYLILVENKVFTTTHDDQLLEYQKLAKEKYHDYDKIFVYLSPNGERPLNIDESYNDNWCIFDYEEVRDIIKSLYEDLSNKNNFPNLDSKNRAKLKLMMEDYITMVNNSILVENPDVWDKIRQIRKNYEKELELINEWQDSSGDALRYCHKRVQEIFVGKIHFVMGETLEENACTFRFWTDEMKTIFDEADGNFGEDTKTPRCYIECTSTYGNIQLIVQKRGEWTSRQKRAVEEISNVKRFSDAPNKLVFQEYFLKKGDRSKKFDAEIQEGIESVLQTFATRLEKELKEISSWKF